MADARTTFPNSVGKPSAAAPLELLGDLLVKDATEMNVTVLQDTLK